MPPSATIAPASDITESKPRHTRPVEGEMDEPKDIGIELHFKGAPAFPAQLILGAIEAVERAVFREESEEIDAMQKELGDVVPAPVFDAMRYRIGDTMGRAINFDRASSGSLLLGGIAVALSYWLLDKTLGETVKESWLDSNLHQRLKTFLSACLKGKSKRIAKDIRPSRWTQSDAEVDISVRQTGPGTETIVCSFVPGLALQPVPTLGEILNSQRNRRPDPPRRR